MRPGPIPTCASAAAICCISCLQDDAARSVPRQLPSHVTVEEVNGVRHVHNAHIPFSDIHLEVDLTLGSDDSGVFFGAEPIVREDREGNIYVIDWTANHINRFTNEGTFLGTIGRSGRGPGEFGMGPIEMGFYPDNRILVSDGSNGRFQEFSPDGEFLKLIIRPKNRPWRFVMDESGNIYEQAPNPGLRPPQEVAAGSAPLVQVSGPDLQVRGTIGVQRISDDPRVGRELNSNLRAVGPGNRLVVAYRNHNAIEIYDDGVLTTVIDRELYFESPTLEVKTSGTNTVGRGEEEITLTADALISGYGMAVDEAGNIYVVTRCRSKYEGYRSAVDDPAVGSVLEVFSSEGWLTHRIPFRGYSPVFLSLGKGNKIYIGDWDTFTVVRFKALSLE